MKSKHVGTSLEMIYEPALIDAWGRRDCAMLESSAASDFLKEILVSKVERRGGGRRFFGEAYVATCVRHRHGYYGSFKWLTNARFLDDLPFPNTPTKRFQEEPRRALMKHFGRHQLEKLQNASKAVERRNRIRPVPPDLWLIDRHG